MITYKSLELKGTNLYDKAVLDLDYKGVTIVYGLNKDANSGSTNASGKSAFFGALPELLFDSSPLVKKRDKRVKGVERVVLSRGSKELAYTRSTSKGVEKLDLVLDGKKLGTRTKAYTMSRVAKFLDRTEEEFFTLDYVDSSRPCIFQRGTTAQRRSFIVSLFRLTDIDSIRKLFASELRQSLTDKAVFTELKLRYSALKKDLSDVDISDLETKVSEYSRQATSLTKKTQQLVEDKHLLELYIENKASLKRASKLCSDLSDIDSEIDKLKSKIAKLELQEEAAQEYQRYQRNFREWKDTELQIKTRLKKLLGSEQSIQIEEASNKIKEYHKYSERLDEVNRQLKGLDIPEFIEIPDKDKLIRKSKWEARLENLKALLLLEGELSEDSSCPTCKQSVPKEVFVNLERDISIARKYLEKAEKVEEAKISNTRRKDLRGRRQELLNTQISLTGKVTRLKPYLKVNQILESRRQKPSSVEKPSIQISDIKTQISELTKALLFLESMAPIVPKLLKVREFSEDQLQSIEALPKLQTKLNRIISELPGLQSQLDRAIQARKDFGEVREKLSALKESVSNEEALRLLIEAYGNSGIKRMMVQRVAKHLQACFNKYARFVYSESYSFKVEAGSNFDVMVNKKYVTGTKTVDVRRFSGAESRMFSLLLVMSFISLMPEHRRSNLLILDEPTANMGKEMQQNFWRFLPILNKVIPHIVVITPKLDEGLDGARLYTAVKHNGTSVLMKGKITQGLSS